MRLPARHLQALLLLLILPGLAQPADIVPNEVQLPGTQPMEVPNLESPGRCDNCHAGYNNATTSAAGEGEPQDEPATGWAGAGMGNAGRDPVFWATVAIAEQDFDGAGDLCIRCHSTGGWYAGRSTPTDGSGLATGDSDGVDCDACHLMANPDNSEHLGVMNSPFFANCSVDPAVPGKTCDTTSEGFYGSGMLSLWGGGDKLGPYLETVARHQFMQSQFHRDVDFCGSCHDVSNSVVGDLAPGNGAQPGSPHVVSSQDLNGGVPNLGGPVEEKAAFNNPPYAYGIVERTFSEYKASALPTTLVSAFTGLPSDLQAAGGSLEVTYQAALIAGTGGNYEDGALRYFSCQSCHMRPTNSAGADKNDVRIRPDLPRHDHTGGNYWLTDMIKYQNSNGQLRLGGDMTSLQLEAIDLGQLRAVEHLQQAASLVIQGDTLKVINLTGHKLITGYPEGRRMWLNIKWYDSGENLVREDGAYGPLLDDADNPVLVENPADESDVQVESILDLDDPNTRIYEAHYAMTSEWATTLIATGKPADLALSYDRYTDEADYSLGELAAQPPGSFHETFHFALNNAVTKDNRIPPYGMAYDTAKKRNVLPVPENQYGNPGTGGTYNYWDQVDLDALKPAGAVSAEITLYYQGTTWEYIQFLEEANNGTDPADGGNAFLGDEGENMLEAWINAEVPVGIEVAGDRKMVPPVVMATANWGTVIEKYTVGGTVSGLAGSGLVLQNNGGDNLTIAANGSFTFATELNNGSSYAVTVMTQPTELSQTCSVSNGSGTISGGNVASVAVTCVTDTFTVGGSVNGLAGTGLVLQNNGGNDLAIAADGGFDFATALIDGSSYSVTVLTQPTELSQTCNVSNGSGTISGGNVTNVLVTCVAETFTVGGSVSDLAGSGLVLQNKGGDNLQIAEDGVFTFASPLADGNTYDVTVLTQPTSRTQTCSVSNGAGTLAGANITNVTVQCVTETFTVGGNVSGLEGAGLVLQNNGDDDLSIAEDGVFTFSTPLDDGSSYNVTILTQPVDPIQICNIANGSDVLAGANIIDVAVTCSTDTYTVGGTVSGLAGSGLVLQNNGGDNLQIAEDGVFTFASPLADGNTYDVTVLTQPTSRTQTCSVSNGAGTLAGANITNVTVQCVTETFTVGGNVSGLEGAGLVLQNNGDDDLSIAEDGVFTFSTPLDDGSSYNVTILTQPADPVQICNIANGSDVLAGANIIDVAVTCSTDTYTVGGTVSGLAGSGLVLQNNGGDNLTIAANGSFTFATELNNGSSYAVTVMTQPIELSQTCSVSNGSGTISGGNVASVAVTCVTDTFTVGGSVSDLAGTGLVLQNNAGDDLLITVDGSFTFDTGLADGSTYAVTVLTQPTELSQTCNVSNGVGTLNGANVTDVSVTCVTDTFTVGGNVSGLAGTGLILQNIAGDDLPIADDGRFTFDTPLDDGSTYDVTVLTQPTGLNQTCSVSSGIGMLDGANVTGVVIQCVTDTFAVGGTVSGLSGTGLILRNNSGDDLVIDSNGSFTFATALDDGSDYSVSILAQPENPSQVCSVNNGSGTLSGMDVSDVEISCVDSEDLIFGHGFE